MHERQSRGIAEPNQPSPGHVLRRRASCFKTGAKSKAPILQSLYSKPRVPECLNKSLQTNVMPNAYADYQNRLFFRLSRKPPEPTEGRFFVLVVESLQEGPKKALQLPNSPHSRHSALSGPASLLTGRHPRVLRRAPQLRARQQGRSYRDEGPRVHASRSN